MRKKFVWCMLWGALLASCNHNRGVPAEDCPDDSAAGPLSGFADSLLLFPETASEEGLSVTADEQFADFIFEFARLRHLRLTRIAFPLPRIIHGDTTWLSAEDWNFEFPFRNQDYYTVLFNDEEQMELEKRTDLDSVDLEWIYLESKQLKMFRFRRLEGCWMLTEESLHPFRESPLADFLVFYERFSIDTDYQLQSVSDPLRYITTDPEDDFGVIEGTLNHDQWEAFKPQLPQKFLTNIRYGQTYTYPGRMILVKQGVSNGLMDILTFRKSSSGWRLVSYEN